jgi:superfamily II DNA or RNA helicase
MNATPEVGQLVHVRNRRWSVLDVTPSSLPAPDGAHPGWRPQNVLRLGSIDDDAHGEELEVVWEIEPGAWVEEAASELPDPRHGFDDPREFEAYVHAVQWGAISQFDLDTQTEAGRLQAPFRSGIHVQDYQLDPLVRALQMPRVSLLIADDVGLGKTIEAGLVAQELVLRHRARRILIVCPAGLQVQWREQMRDKFGLRFKILDRAAMAQLRRERGIHVNPWGHYPRLIVSMDYLKMTRPMHLFRQAVRRTDGRMLPRWGDLLILDEAHNVAPAGTATWVKASDRTRAIREVVDHFEHKLFLTATPHNGNQVSFTALLEMLDGQRFARGVMPDPAQLHGSTGSDGKRQVGALVRRMKSELKKNWDGSSRFPERVIRPLEADYSDTEKELHELLQAYSAARVKDPGTAGGYATAFVMKVLKKRLFSSPQAFATTLEKHWTRMSGRVADTEDEATELRPLQHFLEQTEDERSADDDEAEEDLAAAVEYASERADPLSEEQRGLLERLRRTARSAANRPDAKVHALGAWLNEHVRPNGQWSDERVIIFTEYRDTQRYLHQHLANMGFAADGRLALMYGGMDLDEREKIKQAFQAHPQERGAEVRILLATDTASEGIDLQNWCSKLIHIEIPWNPNVLEQRNGRVDRYGQRAEEVDIYHFVPKGYDHETPDPEAKPGDLAGDLEFLYRAVKKVDQIREDLGKVGPVIAQQVEEALVGGARTRLDTRHAEGGEREDKKVLRFKRNLEEDVARLREQLQATRHELDLSPDAVADVVHAGLALANQPPLEPAEVAGMWPDPNRARCPVWKVPALGGTWASLLEGLEDPHSRRIRPIVFDQALADRRTDVVLAHLNHPLVQRCLRLLRSNIWNTRPGVGLHRVAARLIDDAVLDAPAVIAYGRLVVLGGDAQRIHEEIVSAGGTLREGRFRRFDTRAELDRVLGGSAPGSVSDGLKGAFGELWDKVGPGLQTALDVRMKERIQTLDSRLATRAEREVADVEAILGELARRIREELETPPQMELDLDDRTRWERDVAALEARLEAIPSEIDREAERIRRRYLGRTDADSHLFPFAVTFLIPRSMARGGR